MVVVVLGASTLVEGAIDVLVVLVALELLDLGAAGVGWLNSAWGVGGVIGGAGAVVLITRGLQRHRAADRVGCSSACRWSR